jgi:hypothetical protein
MNEEHDEIGGRYMTFGISSCRDMLAKLGREISRLEAAKTLEDAADHGTNAAIAGWHLNDWIWFVFDRNPTLKARAGEEAKQEWAKKKDFQDWLRKQSRQLSICKKITISLKHSAEDKADFSTRPEFAVVYWMNAKNEKFTWTNEGKDFRLSNLSNWVIVEGEAQYPAIELFKAVHKFWSAFLDHYGIQ